MTPVISRIELNNTPDSRDNIIIVDFEDLKPLLHKDSLNITDIINRIERRSMNGLWLCENKSYSNYLLDGKGLELLIDINRKTLEQLVNNSYVTLIGGYEIRVQGGDISPHIEYYDTPSKIDMASLFNLINMTHNYNEFHGMKTFILMFDANNMIRFITYKQGDIVRITLNFELTDGDTQ